MNGTELAKPHSDFVFFIDELLVINSDKDVDDLGMILSQGVYNFFLKIKATSGGNKSISKALNITMFTPDSAIIPNFPPRLATAFIGKKIDISRDMVE